MIFTAGASHERLKLLVRRWSRSCQTSGMTSQLPQLEILIGRSLAMCAHPYAAWRSHSTAGRALVLFAYVAASYVFMLGALMSF